MQVQHWGEGNRGESVGRDPPCGRDEPRGSMTESAVDETVELRGVAHARRERGFGLSLADGVTQGAAGKLLGAGDAWSSVAPGRPERARLAGVAAA